MVPNLSLKGPLSKKGLITSVIHRVENLHNKTLLTLVLIHLLLVPLLVIVVFIVFIVLYLLSSRIYKYLILSLLKAKYLIL